MFRHSVRIKKRNNQNPKAIRETKNKLTFSPTKKLLPTGFAEQRIDQKSHYPFRVMGFFMHGISAIQLNVVCSFLFV